MKKTMKLLGSLIVLVLVITSLVGCRMLFRRDVPPPEGDAGSNWNDGEYRGEGEGYGGPINVVLTVADGRIDAIVVTQENETDGKWEEAVEVMPQRIIEAQSTEVDVISGATRTSEGIIQAVNVALEAARQQ